MAVSVPNGAIIALASGYGSNLTVTALTNAAAACLLYTSDAADDAPRV